MIQEYTKLTIADNSGAKVAQRIRVRLHPCAQVPPGAGAPGFLDPGGKVLLGLGRGVRVLPVGLEDLVAPGQQLA